MLMFPESELEFHAKIKIKGDAWDVGFGLPTIPSGVAPLTDA